MDSDSESYSGSSGSSDYSDDESGSSYTEENPANVLLQKRLAVVQKAQALQQQVKSVTAGVVKADPAPSAVAPAAPITAINTTPTAAATTTDNIYNKPTAATSVSNNYDKPTVVAKSTNVDTAAQEKQPAAVVVQSTKPLAATPPKHVIPTEEVVVNPSSPGTSPSTPASTPSSTPPAKPSSLSQAMTESTNDLVEKLASMEFRLKEATEECKTVKERNEQSEKEKNLFKNKAYDLAARLSALKKRLQEKEEETAELENKNRDLDAKVTQLKQEVRSTETHLNKSYNDTLEGLTNHIQEAEKQINELDNENNELRFKMTEAQRVCKYLQNKLAESEKNHASVTSDTQFKLTEAQRVSKFLESKLNKMVEEKKKVEERVQELEEEVKKLKSEIHMKDLVIAQQNEKMKQKDAALADASRQILEVEGKLSASVKVQGFLESTLSKAETALARRGPHPEAVKEINDLKKKLAESNDLINALNDGLSIARVGQQTMVDRVGGLEDQVSSLSSELAEKEDEARNYKTKWEIELSKASDLQEKIAILKRASEESRSQVKASETEKQAMAIELKNRVGDLEGNLKIFSDQVHELSNRVLQVESEKKQWQSKAQDLEGTLKSTNNVVGDLKTQVARVEAEKEAWIHKAKELEIAVADVGNMEQLQAQVSQVEKEKKELESKAEVLEVQLATICDILREHKPEIAEMFNNDDSDLRGSESMGSSSRGVGGFAQSLFGNKAVLAVTLAAAVVTIVAGEHKAHTPEQRAALAFVQQNNFDSHRMSTELQAFEIMKQQQEQQQAIFLDDEVVLASMEQDETMTMVTDEFDFVDVVKEAVVVEDVSTQVLGELDAELAEEMRALDRVAKVANVFKNSKDKIWGKLQRMEKPNEDDILSMM